MSLIHSPSIITDGLILLLDASNRKSFIRSTGKQDSLINSDKWLIGNGSSPGFVQNGDTAENTRLLDIDPWGNQSIVWGSFPSGNNESDGGWNSEYFNIDSKKLYRSSVWVRRTSITTSGTFYSGLNTNGTGDSLSVLDNSSNTNPYWDYRNIGIFEQNKWYLVVGHIFPSNYTSTTKHIDSGIYTITLGTTKIFNTAGNAPDDLKFPTNATAARQRVYHYYSADATSRLQFFDPRWDLIDGSEIKIAELLNRSTKVVYDLSKSSNNGNLVNSVGYSRNTKGVFTFNGTTGSGSYIKQNNAFNPRLNDYSLGAWINLSELSTKAIISFVSESWAIGLYTSYINPGVCFSTAYGDASTVYAETLSLNKWYYLVGVREGTTLKVYVNGILSNLKTDVVIDDIYTNYLQIGRMRTGQHEFSGSMSVIQIYNKALSDLEIKHNFNACRSRFSI